MAWDPFSAGLAREEEREKFDPFAAGLAVEDESPNGGAIAQGAKAFARGATAEGIYAAGEGVARIVAQGMADTDRLAAEKARIREQIRAMEGIIESPEGSVGTVLTPEREAEVQQLEGRIVEIDRQLAAAPGQTAAGGYAEQTRTLREQIRESLPVDEAFARSLPGQLAQGLGQAAGTLPAYVVPGLGAAASVGQIYSEAYDDARGSGADDATAHSAAMKYLPAAGLDYLSDRLVVGRILKPLKGRATVGQVLKSIGVTGAAEGATEGAQQAYLNQVAARLEGYDPERAFDQEVYDSMLVGFLVGSGVTATGSAVTAALGPRDNNLPATPEPAALDRAAPSSEATPGAASPGVAAVAFDPFAEGLAQELPDGAADPALAAVPDNLPPTPAPAAPSVQRLLTPSEMMAQAESELAAESPTPAAAPEPAALPPADDFADLEPQFFTRRMPDGFFEIAPPAAVQPAPVEEAGPDVRPADSVPVVAATQPSPAQTGDVTERSGAAEIAAAPAAEQAPKRRRAGRFKLGARPDGVVDLLDIVQELGGVAPRSAVRNAGGEYDGFTEAFGRGPARILVRKGAQSVNGLVNEINNYGARDNTERGAYRFETVDQFYAAVQGAVAERAKVREAMRGQADQQAFEVALYGNDGRRQSQTPAKPVDSDSLFVGAKFRVRGEPFTVTAIDPDTGDLTVQDGPRFGTQKVPAATPIYPDKQSLKQPRRVAPTEDAPFARRVVPAMSADDFFDKVVSGPSAVLTTQGQVVTGWDHGQARDRARERGLDVGADSELGSRAGWLFNGQFVKASELEDGTAYSRYVADTDKTGFARRAVPAADRTADMFSGGETGGDQLFNLQGEEAKDFTGIVDQQAATAQARKQAEADQATLFARRTPDEIREQRARLAQLRARWRTDAERIAPGLMARFGLRFGNPDLLVRAGKVKPEELTGWEQAFYDGHERLLYLFDQALQANTDQFTLINLLHEMGHAHWDTLTASRQEQLALEWEQETAARKGPLYRGGQLRPGVAQGVESDIKEWYAERVAWANHDWARKRAAGEDVRISGPIGRAAQGLRMLLEQLREWVGQLRGQTVDVDFRRFLDQGDRFEATPALQLAAARRDMHADGLAPREKDMPKIAERALRTAQINLAESRRAGSPEMVAKDEAIVRMREEELSFWRNRVAGQQTLFARRVVPGSAHSAPSVAQRMRAAVADIRSFLQRELTSRGHLPADVFKAREARLAGGVAVERQIQFALRDLDAAVRAVYGGWSGLQPADQQALNDVLGGRTPAATLDPRLQGPISTMRRQIDALSRQMIREGIVSGDLAARVAGNVGFYLHRSYRKFDDEKWAAKVPPAVLNRASSFIRAELRVDVVDRLTDRDYNAARGLPASAPAARTDPLWAQIRQGHEANQAIQPDEWRVQGLVGYLLTKDVDAPAALFQPGTDGRKDLSILTRRKEIAPEIRALLGEYEDARINYARSVAKMAQLIESHRFLNEAKRAGMGRFLFAEARPGFAVRIAGEQSRALAPLNGLYTSPEVADAFARVFDERRPQNPAWRLFLALNGWTKTAKTVLHPVTQVRNFVANFGFLVANGHYHAADGGAAVLRGIAAELGKGGQPARDYLTRLARLGVVGESAAANELAEALADAGVKMTGIEELADSVILRAAKLPLRAAQRLYQANDEIFKIYAFENEVLSWRAALPMAPQEQIDQIAAERVRNTLPTYSLVPLAVQRIRRAALLGSFVSFPAEIVRTGYHTLRYAMTDIRSNNPAVRAMGARRLAGIGVAAGLMSVVSAVSRSLAGLDERDEEDLRSFLPEWNQNAQLLFTGADGRGRFSLVDLSYLDPWAYLRRPVVAAMRGEDWADKLGDAALEASSPFLQEGVLAKVLLDLSRNQTADGRPIYNPQAGPIDRQLAKVAHLWTALEPGAITQARRMVKAARGEVSASGRAYSLEDELLALTTGARSQSLNVAQAHSYIAGRYANEQQLAATTYRRVRDRQGTVDPAEIEAARQELDRVRAKLFADMAAANEAAARLGIDQAQLLVNLQAAGLSKSEAAAMLAGRQLPYIDRPLSSIRQVQRLLMDRR